jgi:hypothetical protein
MVTLIEEKSVSALPSPVNETWLVVTTDTDVVVVVVPISHQPDAPLEFVLTCEQKFVSGIAVVKFTV